jgi:hypothetical protein
LQDVRETLYFPGCLALAVAPEVGPGFSPDTKRPLKISPTLPKAGAIGEAKSDHTREGREAARARAPKNCQAHSQDQKSPINNKQNNFHPKNKLKNVAL